MARSAESAKLTVVLIRNPAKTTVSPRRLGQTVPSRTEIICNVKVQCAPIRELSHSSHTEVRGTRFMKKYLLSRIGLNEQSEHHPDYFCQMVKVLRLIKTPLSARI